MARTRELKIKITGDARSAMRALGTLDSTTRTTSSRIGSAFKTVGKSALLGVGALAVGVAAFGKAALDAAQEAAQVGAQTEAVLKSTKNAAGVTAREVDKLATSIMGYAAIEDEAIKSGQNLLLTFMKIRNEAGKGNDIFTQSTKLMVDMSVAMGQDLKSSAIQMGKALNDPIKGLTSLSRVGVAFSDQQKKMITRMVEAGNVMGAQKIILAELRKEFGGSARAVGKTKPWDRFKLAVGEVTEAIGAALLPTIGRLAKRLIRFVKSDEFQAWIKRVADWLKNNLPEAIDATVEFFQKQLIPALKKVGGGISRLIGWIRDLIGWIQNLRNFVSEANEELSRLGEIGSTVRSQLKGVAESLPGIGPIIRGLNNRQHGGPVSALRPYIVGERGPELFVPRASGRIEPNHKLRARGGDVYNINVRADSTTNGHKLARLIREEIVQARKEETRDDRTRSRVG